MYSFFALMFVACGFWLLECVTKTGAAFYSGLSIGITGILSCFDIHPLLLFAVFNVILAVLILNGEKILGGIARDEASDLC